MSRRVSPAMVGGFVVSGILLAVIAVLLFGSGRYFDQRRKFVSFFPGSVGGLEVGSNVAFRGVRVGTVQEVLLTMDSTMSNAGESMRIPVVFEVDETMIRQRGAALSLDDPEQFQFLIQQGLSARLDKESLLTGRLYVSLDFRPDDDPVSTGIATEYPEVPTVRSPMAEVGAKIEELADRLVEVDVEAVLTALRSTLDGFNALVSNPDLQNLAASVDGMVATLDATLLEVQDLMASADSSFAPVSERLRMTAERAEVSLEEIDQTLVALQGVMDPNAPLVVGLVGTFQELERAARALRRVAELVERDPGVLVRGRDTGGGDR